jgi:hypothetical protein
MLGKQYNVAIPDEHGAQMLLGWWWTPGKVKPSPLPISIWPYVPELEASVVNINAETEQKHLAMP